MVNSALLYVRVSSKLQEQEGFSLDAQEKLGHDYALRNRLEVVKTYKVSESAWREERESFNQLIDYARRHSEIGHIIFDVTDRMTRNDFDKLKIYTLIKDHGKTIHFARSNKIFNRESGSEDEFMLDIEVAVAKKMSNDISRKTRMGMQEKAEQGFYPSTAPTGYKNNRLTGMIELDEERAPHIKRMFELMSTGRNSCEMISQQLYSEGFRNKRGTLSKDNAIAHYLRNPIYYGAFQWKGRVLQGGHTPIISKDLFDKVQDVLSGKSKIHIQRKGFAFNNLILCGSCGCKVIGELKKNRYHYYHCTFSKGRHEAGTYLREEKVADLIGETIKPISWDNEIFDWFKESLREEKRPTEEFQEKRLNALKTEETLVKNRLSKLYDSKFDGIIKPEIFAAKEKEYEGQIIEIKHGMEKLTKINPNYYEDGCLTLELGKSLYPWYVRANLERKAQIANIAASNYSLIDANLIPKRRRPFSIFAERPSSTRWLPGTHSPTSFFRGGIPDLPL
jgi:DNA invertase Pin-like site-specific DNA recombinase